MQLTLVDTKETIEVSENIFGQKFNEPLIHQVVNAYLAGGRAGTSKQKTRSEVQGGGKKPWRQKGTGRARAGTIRSPIWRGGGIIFAARPRDYSQKVNKKMYRAAMISILSELARKNKLKIVNDFEVSQTKTKELVKKLQDFEIVNALLVVDNLQNDLYLSARNIPHIEICDSYSLNPINLVSYEQILITSKGVKQIEEHLA